MEPYSASSSVALRVQGRAFSDQVIVLARIAESRAKNRSFTPRDLNEIFVSASLPRPKNISDVFAKLNGRGLITSVPGGWTLTPMGRQLSLELVSNLDLTTFLSESAQGASTLGNIAHTVVPPELAPPGLIVPLQKFLKKHPFETNVFGISRFPDPNNERDPIAPALDTAREVCSRYGLQFHLASDRAILPDLWDNVVAHIWASQYGIAFFEDTVDRGLNYNLTIEVGCMLMSGRRCALLRDPSVDQMPSDLVSKIYHCVDLRNPKTIETTLKNWIRGDLGLE